MQPENIEEYKLLRVEMEAVKKCITDYMGYFIIGSAASFSAWGAIGSLGDNFYSIPLGYALFAMSVLSVLLFYILIYKFQSHNRYVGYCECISREKWKDRGDKSDEIDEMHLWEVCLSAIQVLAIEDEKRRLEAITYEKLPPEVADLSRSSNDYKNMDRENTLWHAIRFISRSIWALQITYSWGFPMTVMRIFLVAVVSSLGFGIWLLWPAYGPIFPLNDWEPGKVDSTALIITSLVLVTQAICWSNIALRIHWIMRLEETVQYYRDKFSEIRKGILKRKYNIDAEYDLDVYNQDVK